MAGVEPGPPKPLLTLQGYRYSQPPVILRILTAFDKVQGCWYAMNPSHKLIIGLTGGIGSGKSAAAARFGQAHGIHVVAADIKSRVVVETGRPALHQIVDRFGDAVLQADGSLNRAALRERVFEDADERRWLEQLLHPLIREEIIVDLASAESPYALLVSPLLVESGQYRMTERVLVVDVPEELQIARTTARDNVPEQQVRAILQAQAQREERLRHAHDVITNDQDLAALHAQVDALHQRYLNLARGARA